MAYPEEHKGMVRINQGGGLVTLKKSGFRNMITPINVSSFFYDPPLKSIVPKACTISNVRRTLPLTAGGPGQSPASLEKDLNGLKEEDTGRPVPRD